MKELSKSEAVKVLRKEYQPWIDSLDEQELKALRKYTLNSVDFKKPNRFFERLNAMLRGDYSEESPDYKRLQWYSKIISNAIKKHPIQHNVVCYRGTNYNPALGFSVGDIFYYDPFTSTSLLPKGAFRKRYLSIIHVPVGANVAYIEKISLFSYQKELLLDKGSLMRLIDIKENGKIFEMEVCVNEEDNKND